jgi:hypothetical protein
MRLSKVSNLHRKELSALLRLLAPEEVFSYSNAAHSDLVELVYSALAYMFMGEPMEYNDLEVEYFKRISKILDVKSIEEDIDVWNQKLRDSLGNRILEEIMPILQVAHVMSWADGNFVSEELEVYDIVLSQLKLLKPFKKAIVEFCLNPLPAATIKADLAPISENVDKARCILSFAWAIALVDAETHINEVKLFKELGNVLNFSSEEKLEIQLTVEKRWKYLQKNSKIVEPAQLVVYSSGIDDYIRRAVGFDAFEIISKITGEKLLKKMEGRKSIAETFNSLTLFSKMSLITGPKLNLIDRIVLVMGLVLSEMS